MLLTAGIRYGHGRFWLAAAVHLAAATCVPGVVGVARIGQAQPFSAGTNAPLPSCDHICGAVPLPGAMTGPAVRR